MCIYPKEIQDKEVFRCSVHTYYNLLMVKKISRGGVRSKEEYYEILKNSKEIPKTSQATYIQFICEIFNKYIDEGYKIICMDGSF